MAKQRFEWPGEEAPLSLECQVTPEGYTVLYGEEQANVVIEATEPNAGTLYWQGDVIPFYFYQEGTRLSLWIRGKVYALEAVDLSPRRGGADHGSRAATGDVKAPMPGTLLKLKVQEGDTVEANQPVIIMESMKMEMTLTAPKAGWVAKIAYQEGDMVEMGAQLLKIEEKEA